MTDRQWSRVLGVALAMMLLAIASSAHSQPLPEGSSPKFTADSPTTGAWIATWNTAGTDTTRGVSLLSVSADTETLFTAYWWRSTRLPHKVKWPLFGPTPGDTTYIVPAGQTMTFRWPKPWVSYIIVESGDATFQGE